MRQILICVSILVLVICTPGHCIDDGVVELGTDISFAFTNVNTRHYTSINVPALVRIGAYISPSASLEFRYALSALSTRGSSLSAMSMIFGALTHLSGQGATTIPFCELLGSLNVISGESNASQFGLGAGIGVKGHGHPFNPRGEIMFIKRFESGDAAGSTSVQLNIGVSFFSK